MRSERGLSMRRSESLFWPYDWYIVATPLFLAQACFEAGGCEKWLARDCPLGRFNSWGEVSPQTPLKIRTQQP
jgi:hypothetical protein